MRHTPEQRVIWLICKMQITELRAYIRDVEDPHLRVCAKRRLAKLRRARNVDSMTHRQLKETAKKAFRTIDGLRGALKVSKQHIAALQQDLRRSTEEATRLWHESHPESMGR